MMRLSLSGVTKQYPAVRANDGGGRAGLAAEVEWAADVGAEAVDVKLVEHPPCGREVARRSRLQVLGAGHKSTLKGPRGHPARQEQQ